MFSGTDKKASKANKHFFFVKEQVCFLLFFIYATCASKEQRKRRVLCTSMYVVCVCAKEVLRASHS